VLVYRLTYGNFSGLNIGHSKKNLKDRGIEVAGGITVTIANSTVFKHFVPQSRRWKKVKELSECPARNFNEFILDNLFLRIVKMMAP